MRIRVCKQADPNTSVGVTENRSGTINLDAATNRAQFVAPVIESKHRTGHSHRGTSDARKTLFQLDSVLDKIFSAKNRGAGNYWKAETTESIDKKPSCR